MTAMTARFAALCIVLALLTPGAAHSAVTVPWMVTAGGQLYHWAVTNECCLRPFVNVGAMPSGDVGNVTGSAFSSAVDKACTSLLTASGNRLGYTTSSSCYVSSRTVVLTPTATPSVVAAETTWDCDPNTGVISGSTTIFNFGDDDWDLEVWQTMLDCLVLHEMGHTAGFSDALSPCTVMMKPLCWTQAWSADEQSSLQAVYTASSVIGCGGPGPALIRAMATGPGEDPSQTRLFVDTDAEVAVDSLRVRYSTNCAASDSEFVVLGSIPLTHEQGGSYVFAHSLQYPPQGVYLLEGINALGQVSGTAVHFAAEQPTALEPTTSTEMVRAENTARIRSWYWREIAVGSRAVRSIDDLYVPTCEYLVLAYQGFARDVAAICDYWEFAHGLDVDLVSVDGALHSPEAIRSYIAQVNRSGRLNAILLVGVPAFPSAPRPEVCLVPTDVSEFDHYYADANDDGLLEFVVGRLPAKSAAEVVSYVNKELRYNWDVSWGGRKDPAKYARQLLIQVPDDRGCTESSNWRSTQWAVQNCADAVSGVLQGVAQQQGLDVAFIDFSQLPAYCDGNVPARLALQNSIGAALREGQHVVYGLSEHNSSGLQFSMIEGASWLSATTTNTTERMYSRPCETFWITPNCGAASVYCNPLREDGSAFLSIPYAELFLTDGLAIFGPAGPSWGAVIAEVMPRMTNKILNNAPDTDRPLSLGEAWRATYVEVRAGSTVYPTGLEYFGILGDPMLFVRHVYDEAASVKADAEATLAIAAAPTPANGRVQLKVSGLISGRAIVRVYDVRGMRVYETPLAPGAAGDAGITWNGTDATGKGVASGLYVAQIENGGRTAKCQVVYVK